MPSIDFIVKLDSEGRTELKIEGFGSVTGRFEFDLSERVEQVLQEIEAGYCKSEDLKDVGSQLFSGLFAQELGKLFQMGYVERQDQQINLRITASGWPDLPWEALYDKQRDAFFISNPRHSVIRDPLPEGWPQPDLAPRKFPLKILVAIPHRSGLNVYGVWEDLSSALTSLIPHGVLKLERLDAVTPDRLQERLKSGVDILHYVGHGRTGAAGPEIRLNHPDSPNGDLWMGAEAFASLFRGAAPRLVVLNCRRGAAEDAPPRGLSGIGAYLMKVGIPATVAMRYEVSGLMASRFAASFYLALFKGEPGRIDAAVARARYAHYIHREETNYRDFIAPVLYLARGAEQLNAIPVEHPLSQSSSSAALKWRSGSDVSAQAPASPRFLRATVYLQTDDPNYFLLNLKEAFSARHKHFVDVSIGPKTGLSVRFRDDLLPPTSKDGYLLTVVFHEPTLLKEPQVGTLYLPRKGEALPFRFSLPAPEGRDSIEARITILHENRVLQTALLKGPVVPLTEEQLAQLRAPDLRQDADQNGIRLSDIQNVFRAEKDLEARSRFDASLVLNHADGAPGATAVSGNKAAYIRLDQNAITEKARKIDALLNRSDWDEAAYQQLESPETANLLRKLAYAGLSLRMHVVDNFGPFLANAEKVQVVAARAWTRLPVEFIYDFDVPDETAPLCPNARMALRKTLLSPGRSVPACPEDCPPQSQVVCPMGFWCMNRVIEWHAFSEQNIDRLRGAEFLIETQDQGRSNTLKLMHNALLGYTNRVTDADAESINKLAGKFHPAPIIVQSWKKWRDSIGALSPTFLLLLIHTEHSAASDSTVMELGDGKTEPLLSVLKLKVEDVWAKNALSPPVLLLLGCSTGVATIQFDSVAAAFASKGAAIVVSANAEIYAPVAAAIGAIFVEYLQDFSGGQSFGDLMLRVRRKAMSEGQLMVLCLTTYGDADWRLEK